MTVNFITVLLLAACLLGCGGAHQSATIGWAGEKVRVQITPGGSSLFSKPTLTCVSCKTAIPPFPLSPDPQGVVEFSFPETKTQITTRFYLEGNGLDTAIILQPPAPEIVERQHKLLAPLKGRIMVTELALVYRDTSLNDAVTSLEREDEANIFGENDLYYFVHHPAYGEPLVVVKSNAIRIR